jgi:hypothetical protein
MPVVTLPLAESRQRAPGSLLGLPRPAGGPNAWLPVQYLPQKTPESSPTGGLSGGGFFASQDRVGRLGLPRPAGGEGAGEGEEADDLPALAP